VSDEDACVFADVEVAFFGDDLADVVGDLLATFGVDVLAGFAGGEDVVEKGFDFSDGEMAVVGA
jgi:hypothetical protein